MRQHPIPQNILDVEFKLFTKYTIKEFVYIASGVVIGSIFIYLWTEGRMPGILAFPLFAFFSGTGLALGLIPIQDQPLDRILSNYIKAINKPTLRVWQGEEMKRRLKQAQKPKKASTVETHQNIAPQVNLADIEEEEKLKQIDKLMDETGLAPKQKTQTTQTPNIENKGVTITKENIDQYIIPNVQIELKGTINMQIVSKQKKPIPNAVVIVKDKFEKPRLAVRSGVNGEVLTNKKLENGEYKIEIIHEQYDFKKINFIVEKEIYPVIRITSI